MRIFFALAFVLIAGLALPDKAAKAEVTVRVGKAIGVNFAFVPADVAIAAGIFRKHGIDAQIVNFNGSAKLQQGLASGAIDIGLGSGPEMSFVAKGNDDIAVAAIADLPRTAVMIVRKDGPIKTVDDLKGRVVSCSSANSLSNWLGRELSKQMGWGPDGIKMTPLGGMSAQFAALKTGQIDGMMAETTTAFIAEEEGSARILVNFGDRYKHFIVHVMYARKEFVKEHPDVLRSFIAAWFETIEYMNSHKDETVAIAERVTQVKTSIAEKNYRVLMPMMNKVGTFDPKALEILADSWSIWEYCRKSQT